MTIPTDAANWRRLFGVLTLAISLGGCSVLDKPARAVVYDFGPDIPGAAAPSASAERSVVTLAEVIAPGALDSTAVFYRLAYADVQQLLPYAQARWSMPPAQLMRQRLRETLVRQHVVMRDGNGLASVAQRALVLQLEIDEFSQLFTSPTSSIGLVRVHATVVRPSPAGDQLVAQRDFVARRDAPSPDAAGGVRALTAATDGLLEEISAWLIRLR